MSHGGQCPLRGPHIDLPGLTIQLDRGGISQSILLQFSDVNLSSGGHVGPCPVRHTDVQQVRPWWHPLPDAELPGGLVESKQPEETIQVSKSLYCHLLANIIVNISPSPFTMMTMEPLKLKTLICVK